MGSVETLICWENFDNQQHCVLNNHALLLHLTSDQDKSCVTEKELVESQPLLEWLASNYKNFGATLEIVTDKSKEGSQFVKGFGGIGGEFVTLDTCSFVSYSTHTLYNVLYFVCGMACCFGFVENEFAENRNTSL